jgi:hypothetical protein
MQLLTIIINVGVLMARGSLYIKLFFYCLMNVLKYI